MENNTTDTDITLEHSTSVEKNIQENVIDYYRADNEAINIRLQKLDEEWDIERVLQLNAASISLTGVVLSILSHKKFIAIPLIVNAFLLNHALGGWCPPETLFRRLGYRSRSEIDKEKFALKTLRGDFQNMLEVPNAIWNAVNK